MIFQISFELVEAVLKLISTKEPGAVLIFLPGWNLIFAMLKFLQTHPIFGTPNYVILPLHSQLTREDQRKVFLNYPSNCRKVYFIMLYLINIILVQQFLYSRFLFM